MKRRLHNLLSTCIYQLKHDWKGDSDKNFLQRERKEEGRREEGGEETRETQVGGYHTIQQSSPVFVDMSFQILHIIKVKQEKSYHPYPTKPAQQKQANLVDAKGYSI